MDIKATKLSSIFFIRPKAVQGNQNEQKQILGFELAWMLNYGTQALTGLHYFYVKSRLWFNSHASTRSQFFHSSTSL